MGRAHSKALTCHRPSELEGLRVTLAPTSPGAAAAEAGPDLCTSCVFSCFSLLFRSPLVRLSFSSSVTFFSRKLTYHSGVVENTFESMGQRT